MAASYESHGCIFLCDFSFPKCKQNTIPQDYPDTKISQLWNQKSGSFCWPSNLPLPCGYASAWHGDFPDELFQRHKFDRLGDLQVHLEQGGKENAEVERMEMFWKG